MGLFKKNKPKEKKFLGNSPEQSQIIIANSHNSELLLDNNYITVAREAFKGNPDGYACIDKLCDAVAKLNYKVGYKNKNGDTEYIQNHEFLQLLNKPNPDEGKYEYMYKLILYFILSGQMFQRQITITSKPVQLYTMRPDRMGMLLSKTEQLGWYFHYAGNKKRYEINEISYLRLPDPENDFLGFSPLRAAAYAIDGNNASDKWNFSMIKNGARPSGILKTKSILQQDTLTRLKEMIKGWFGEYNAGKGIILEDGLEWQQLSLSQKDMDNLNYVKLNSKKIAQVLGIPSELIGDTSTKTYNSYVEANKIFHKDKVLPLVQRIVDDWNIWLMPMYGENLFLEIDKESIDALKDDLQITAEITRQDYEAGIITRAEARQKRGMDFTEQDKVYKVRVNEFFIDEKGKILDTVSESKKKRLELEKKQDDFFYILEIEEILNEIIGLNFEEEILSTYKTQIYQIGNSAIKEVGMLFEFNLYDESVVEMFNTVAGQRLTWIDDTLLEKLRSEFAEGITQGESLTELINRLDVNVFEGYKSGYELERIVRSESTWIKNESKLEGWKQSGVVDEKEWLSVQDDRTRGNNSTDKANHLHMNGQIKKINEPFFDSVLNDYAMYPGGFNNPAGNVLCRCTMLAVVKGTKSEFKSTNKWIEEERQRKPIEKELKKAYINYFTLIQSELNRILNNYNFGEV